MHLKAPIKAVIDYDGMQMLHWTYGSCQVDDIKELLEVECQVPRLEQHIVCQKGEQTAAAEGRHELNCFVNYLFIHLFTSDIVFMNASLYNNKVKNNMSQ